MKISKILAAGVAATLAVTSLASVASAAEKTFGMGSTVGSAKLASLPLYYFTDNLDSIDGAEVKNMTLTITDKGGDLWNSFDNVKMVVTGYRGVKTVDATGAEIIAAATSESKETYSFKDGVLTLTDNYVNQAGQANLSSFKQITGVKITVDIKATGLQTAADYDACANNDGNNAQAYVTCSIVNGTGAGADNAKFTTALTSSAPDAGWVDADRETNDLYPFLPVTTGNTTVWRNQVKPLSETNGLQSRSLQATAAWDYAGNSTEGWNSSPAWAGGPALVAWAADNDGNQKDDGTGYGNAPRNFAGLAGQVAAFFNKQSNGTITFKFASGNVSGTQWNAGGIPSTEIGLLGSTLNSTAFALFFNYNTTTGKLQSAGEVNSSDLSVTFKMDDVLDQLNGQTVGVIHDVWYAMNDGVQYTGILANNVSNGQNHFAAKGYLVESVTLAYNEDASAGADVDDEDDAPVADDEDDAQIDDADDADDYDDADDDEDDAVVDDTADDGEVAADVVVVTPADDDANPGTGVALAIVPAILAGAAVVISRKRK